MQQSLTSESKAAFTSLASFSRASCAVSMLAALLAVPGCYPEAKPFVSKIDPLALQQMQTQRFDTSKEILFASTVSVFQDKGFIIESGDLATGIITAKSPTSVAGIGWNGISNGDTVEERATAFIESIKPGTAQARLNFIERRELQRYGKPQDTPRENAAYYEEVFARIREAVFLREANRGTDGAKK